MCPRSYCITAALMLTRMSSLASRTRRRVDIAAGGPAHCRWIGREALHHRASQAGHGYGSGAATCDVLHDLYDNRPPAVLHVQKPFDAKQIATPQLTQQVQGLRKCVPVNRPGQRECERLDGVATHWLRVKSCGASSRSPSKMSGSISPDTTSKTLAFGIIAAAACRISSRSGRWNCHPAPTSERYRNLAIF